MSRSRGQSLVEFALVFPILMILVGGIIQFGIIFWAQNTLTQIARDTGRWAATQQTCGSSEESAIDTKAREIAQRSSLIGYPSGTFSVSSTWQTTSGTCPPNGNQQTSFVTITLTHQVPIFFPFVPGNGNLSSSTQFRMEPVSQP